MTSLLVELVSNDDAAGKRERRKAGANLLVPQGGFEPSTYRLRSDCSAVELLRRPQASLVAKKPGAVETAYFLRHARA
jgi:hypothetical protein